MKAGFITLGCRVNQYESADIADKLEKIGFERAEFNEKCDVYIINTCAVTEESVRKSKQMIRRAIKKNPDAFVGVMGCASQLEGEKIAAIKGVSFVCGTRNKNEMVSAVSEFLKNGSVGTVVSVKIPEGNLPPTLITRSERTRAYVKIEDGCNGKCAYCIIPSLRGGVVKRDFEQIVSEVRCLAEGGCSEVVLTGIETAAYGKELVELVRKIADVEGIERIRTGSLEPSFLKNDIIDALLSIPKFCPHIHVSVQNGSSRILAKMRRKYNRESLIKNLLYAKEKYPEINFSADIIVGFPGESEEDFADTVDLVRRIGFLHLHIFPYSPRPKTEAASMENQVSDSVKSDRLHRLEAIGAEEKEKILNGCVLRGQILNVLIESAKDGYLTGHNESFIECKIISDDSCGAMNGSVVRALPLRTDNGVLICTLV